MDTVLLPFRGDLEGGVGGRGAAVLGVYGEGEGAGATAGPEMHRLDRGEVHGGSRQGTGVIDGAGPVLHAGARAQGAGDA